VVEWSGGRRRPQPLKRQWSDHRRAKTTTAGAVNTTWSWRFGSTWGRPGRRSRSDHRCRTSRCTCRSCRRDIVVSSGDRFVRQARSLTARRSTTGICDVNRTYEVAGPVVGWRHLRRVRVGCATAPAEVGAGWGSRGPTREAAGDDGMTRDVVSGGGLRRLPEKSA
jgi:hypothetical protein